MNRLFPALIAAAILTPACCVFQKAHHPELGLNAAEQVESKTVSMVRWIKRGVDADGDPTVVDAQPGEDGAKLVPYCAGVWVNRNTFVTAEHCVDDLGKPDEIKQMEKIKEMIPDGLDVGLPPIPQWDPTGADAEYSAFGDIRETKTTHFQTTHSGYVLAIDREHDLALVRATVDTMDPSVPEHLTAQVATDVHVGDPVDVVGNPHGLWWSYIHGYIGAIRPNMSGPHDRQLDIIQVSAPAWFGNSGGGAFNSNGELVGIFSFIKDDVPNMSFCIHFEYIADLIKDKASTRRH